MSDNVLDFLYDEVEETPIEEVQAPVQEEVQDDIAEPVDITQTIHASSIMGPFIPKNDFGYIEQETITIQGQQPLHIQYNIPPKPKLVHEIEMWDAINNFETQAWSSRNRGIKSGWKSIDDAFDGGLKPGFVVVGGDSNLGKSAFVSQMAWQVCENNDDVYVMDFSLDDAMPDKLARVIGAGSKVILNAVTNPNGYSNMPTMLIRRKEALNKLRANTNKYKAYDANFSTFIEDIEKEIERVKILIDASGQEKKLVVFIDSFHDLNIKNGQAGMSDKQKCDFLAQWCADVAIKYDIPVICTAELRKLNGTMRAGVDHIRESVKIKYEAKAIILIYNEVHYKAEAAEVYFMRANDPMKQPVFEAHFAKNKISSFKGRLFFEFYPEMARMEEPDIQSRKHYASVIYGN